MVNKRLLLMALLIASGVAYLSRQETPRAGACSYSPPTIESMMMEDGVIVVLGRFVETDSTERNGIFEVRQYLAGEVGAKYLLIDQAPPELINIMYGGDSSCAVPGIIVPKAVDTILFLTRNDDGSFRSEILENYHFLTDESVQSVTITYDKNAQAPVIEDLTLAQLMTTIATISNASPRDPDPTRLDPFHAPLLIITDQHSAYMLPLDGGPPVQLMKDFDNYKVFGQYILFVKDNLIHWVNRGNLDMEELSMNHDSLINCPQQNCVGISPQGIYGVAFIPGSHLLINSFYRNVPRLTSEADGYSILQLEGPVYGFQFSPNDNLLAVWREDTIEIVALYQQNSLVYIDSLHVIQTGRGLLKEGVWSEDERQLAFSDEAGLWVWDVVSGHKELVIPQEGALPIATGFSPAGNYLTVEAGNEHYIIEIETKRRLGNGIVSPDDQWVAEFSNEENPYGQLCNLMVNQCQPQRWGIAEAFWLNEQEFLIWSYDNGIGQPATRKVSSAAISEFELYSELCQSTVAYRFPEPDEQSQLPWYYGIHLDFEPISEAIVVQNDLDTISIGYQVISWKNVNIDMYYPQNTEFIEEVCGNFVTFDLAEQLDGDIISVEWLPSVYYPN